LYFIQKNIIFKQLIGDVRGKVWGAWLLCHLYFTESNINRLFLGFGGMAVRAAGAPGVSKKKFS
jgi:hypothetical protein